MFISRQELKDLRRAAHRIEDAERRAVQAQNDLRVAEQVNKDIHTRYENTLEEVFRLRDQIQAFGECLGLELISTQDGGIAAVVGKEKEELETAIKNRTQQFRGKHAADLAVQLLSVLDLMERERGTK